MAAAARPANEYSAQPWGSCTRRYPGFRIAIESRLCFATWKGYPRRQPPSGSGARRGRSSRDWLEAVSDYGNDCASRVRSIHGDFAGGDCTAGVDRDDAAMPAALLNSTSQYVCLGLVGPRRSWPTTAFHVVAALTNATLRPLFMVGSCSPEHRRGAAAAMTVVDNAHFSTETGAGPLRPQLPLSDRSRTRRARNHPSKACSSSVTWQRQFYKILQAGARVQRSSMALHDQGLRSPGNATDQCDLQAQGQGQGQRV